MSVDCVDAGAGDGEVWGAAIDGFGSYDELAKDNLRLWNGRYLDFITARNERLGLLSQFYAAALRERAILEQMEASHRIYHLLELTESKPSEESPIHFTRDTSPLPILPHCATPRSFAIADPFQSQRDIENCKNVFSRAFEKVKKCAKTIKDEVVDGAKKVYHFVKEHKKEIAIGAGALVLTAGIGMGVAALVSSAAAGVAAAEGSSHKRREEEDPPTPKSPPSNADPKIPVPSTFPIFSNPPSEQPSLQNNTTTLFQHDTVIPNVPLDLLFNNSPPNTPELPPTSPDTIPLKSAFAGFLESKNQAVVPTEAPFDLHYKNNTPYNTQELPIVPPQQSAVANFLESIGQGVASIGAHLPSAGFLPTHRASLFPPEPSQPSCYVRIEGFTCVGKQIGVINGMNTSSKENYEHLKYTKNLASGMSIEGVYNRSHWIGVDLLEIFLLNYPGFAPVTGDLLIENWTRFHEENKHNPDAKYLQIAHSMGTILTRNALHKAPQEIRDRIIVVAVGTAVVIPDELCHRSFCYASKKDLVHLGQDLHTRVRSAFSDEFEQQALLDQLLENKEKLILLDPHPDAKGIDHDYESLTLRRVLEHHITAYLNR